MATTSKVKIDLDAAALDLLAASLAALRQPGGIVPCLELECLVLMEFERKHLEVLTYAMPPVRIGFKPHEALSLRRLLFNVGLQDPIGNIARNHICDAVQRELAGLC